jgi:hypothetical protein
VNTPLTNLSVSVDSQVVGGTNSTIECKQGSTVKGSATTPANGDVILNVNDLPPGTYICTVVIDP